METRDRDPKEVMKPVATRIDGLKGGKKPVTAKDKESKGVTYPLAIRSGDPKTISSNTGKEAKRSEITCGNKS